MEGIECVKTQMYFIQQDHFAKRQMAERTRTSGGTYDNLTKNEYRSKTAVMTYRREQTAKSDAESLCGKLEVAIAPQSSVEYHS